jgi:hypothetical protein
MALVAFSLLEPFMKMPGYEEKVAELRQSTFRLVSVRTFVVCGDF